MAVTDLPVPTADEIDGPMHEPEIHAAIQPVTSSADAIKRAAQLVAFAQDKVRVGGVKNAAVALAVAREYRALATVLLKAGK